MQLSIAQDTKIKKHSVIFDNKGYTEQPQGQEMAKISTRLKKTPFKSVAINEIMQLSARGYSFIPARLNVDENNQFVFESGSMFAIDIDDDLMKTDPEQVAERFNAVGAVYTFNHGIKGNRYRLFFQLARPEPNRQRFEIIIRTMKDELLKEKVPADNAAITLPIRGGKSYFMRDINATLENEHFIQTAKQRSEEQQRQRARLEPTRLESVIPFEELQKACEAIGYVSSGAGEGDKWAAIVYGIKSYEQQGYITPIQAEELHDIVSGGETPYSAVKNATQATIGSVIHYAKLAGYNPKALYFDDSLKIEKKYKESHIKIDRYLTKEQATEILDKRQRTLVDSPTGSGKTSSFIKAMLEKEKKQVKGRKQKHFYIFAVPTRALVKQIAKDHKITHFQGEDNSRLFNRFLESVYKGKRVFVATYDKVDWLTAVIEGNSPYNIFSIVVDEYHKLVNDLHYRKKAINGMLATTERAKNFIALSGTIHDIDKNSFDEVITVKGGKRSPNKYLTIYEYENNTDSKAELVEIVKGRLQHNRLLIYLQSKEEIKRLVELLRSRGVKAAGLDSNEKDSDIYKHITDNSQIPNEIDVLVTTSVIADGINIKNDTVKWEIIAVSSTYSNLYNASTMKQISNRFRNTYERFSIFIQKDERDPIRYNLESAYYKAYQRAKEIVEDYEKDPFFNIALHKNSVIERYYGLYMEKEKLHFDPLTVRFFSVMAMNNFYRGFRNGFIEEVQAVFEQKITQKFNVSELLRQDEDIAKALEELQQEIDDQAEREKEIEELKALSIEDKFTQEVYRAFVENDSKRIAAFKEITSQPHFSYISATYDFLRYEVIKKTVSNITRNAESRVLRRRIVALLTLWHWKHFRRPNKTKNVFNELLEHAGELYLNSDWKEVFKLIAKKKRYKQTEVEKVFKEFALVANQRNGRERLKILIGEINFHSVAEETGLTHEELAEAIRNYADIHGTKQEKQVAEIELKKLGFHKNERALQLKLG